VTQDTKMEDRAGQDEWLVVRCQLGERLAFDALIERWHAPLWRYVRQLTSNDDVAREIAQEVWLRVIRGISRLRDGAKWRAWLFGIARRVLMDRLRAQYAMPLVAENEIAEVPVEHADVDREVFQPRCTTSSQSSRSSSARCSRCSICASCRSAKWQTSCAFPSVPSNHGSFAPGICCGANWKPEETSYEHEHDFA
jgi:RNA polymerase sigma factor (sigma-70 family)